MIAWRERLTLPSFSQRSDERRRARVRWRFERDNDPLPGGLRRRVCCDPGRKQRRAGVVSAQALVLELVADRVVVACDEATVIVVCLERSSRNRTDVQKRKGKVEYERKERGGGRDLTQRSSV